MERKDPLEGSLLGSGWKACIHAQHSASTLPAGRSLSSQTWPGLYLSWAEVPSSFSPAPRLKPQLKHETEEMSSKLYPNGVTTCGIQLPPPGGGEFEEVRKTTFVSPLLKQFDFLWNIKTLITYVNNLELCVLAVSHSIKDKKIWCPVSVNTMPWNFLSDLRGNKIKAPHVQEQEWDESACHPLVSSVSL